MGALHPGQLLVVDVGGVEMGVDDEDLEGGDASCVSCPPWLVLSLAA